MYMVFGGKTLRERGKLEESCIDGNIIIRLIFRKWDMGVMDWIELAQDLDRWREFVNEVMNVRDP
jgi:hypothetical protein